MIYHLTRRLFDRATARVAAVFVALTFLLVRNSHYATTDATTTFLLVSFPIAYFLVAGGGRLLFHRYMILVVPFLCVLAAFFTVAAGRWVAARLRLPSPAVVGALAVLTVAPTAWSAIRDDQLLARTDSRVLAAQWLRERAQPGQALYQTGTHYGWIQLERGPRRYVNWNYNREFGLFRVGGDWAPGLPDWIVVQESPIPYSHGEIPPRLADLLRRRYDLCHRVRAVNPRDPRNIYDMQDALYLPYAGFSNVTRPGPNIYIWKLRDDSGP